MKKVWERRSRPTTTLITKQTMQECGCTSVLAFYSLRFTFSCFIIWKTELHQDWIIFCEDVLGRSLS